MAINLTSLDTDLVVAQFSDSHLFADINGKHHGALVAENLSAVCCDIAQDKQINLAIFTGDLTQDHSEASYQLFVDIVSKHLSHVPVLFLAGNHDDVELLNRYLLDKPFVQGRLFENEHWQFHLINSKSNTPAGLISPIQLAEMTAETNGQKHQFYFMHHHPKDVDYFIDRHGLTDHYHFWQWLANQPNVKGIACGHVHRGMEFSYQAHNLLVPVFTCPATSIQFAKHPSELVAEATQPAYRKLAFHKNGQVSSQVIQL